VARKLTDADRARIALGWAESGLRLDDYAAQFGVTGRAVRKWRSRLVNNRNPIEQVEAVLVDTIAVFQTLLASVRAQAGSAPERAERDGHLGQLAADAEVGCSAAFRPEQHEVGTADPEQLVSDIIEPTRTALASVPPMPVIKSDRPEQNPVDMVGSQPSRPLSDGADGPRAQPQPEPADVVPIPMPRASGGFITPY
jgi:hypothetical protein